MGIGKGCRYLVGVLVGVAVTRQGLGLSDQAKYLREAKPISMKLNNLFIKLTIIFICLLTLISPVTSCSSKSENKQGSNKSSTYSNSSDYEDEYNDESDETSEYLSGCRLEDGTYSATVDYYNPETGYSTTYTLDVDVQDCQVVQINFPNDGYLDEDHISYADLDEDGTATVYGEDGKTYEIQIEE